MPFFRRKESRVIDERFLGTWRLVKSDGSIDVGNGVTMTFTRDGKLVYVIHRERADEIMSLVFTVDGDCLITNQPSRPQTERTGFAFDAYGHLVLDYGDTKAWFARV